MTETLVHPEIASEAPRMSVWRQAAISLYWFANSTQWTALFIILLPLQAERIGGAAQKGTVLGVILLVGALTTVPMMPLCGAVSDHLRTRWGRRVPLILAGAVGNILGLLALAWLTVLPPSLWLFLAAIIGLEISNSVVTIPYSALIPDIVPTGQRGSASGWLGLMVLLGNFAGGAVGLALPYLGMMRVMSLLLPALLVIGMLVTALNAHERMQAALPPFNGRDFLRSLPAPFRKHDFRWVFLTRLLILLGVYTVQEYLQYYLKDVVAGGAATYPYRFFGHTLAMTAPAATSYIVIAILLGATASSLVGGILSDRIGRKRVVYLSGGLQALVALVVIFAGSFQVFLIMGVVLGLGYGAYLAVDWALGADVLPEQTEYAKDMGIWSLAYAFAQIAAAPIAGLLIDFCRPIGHRIGLPALGYYVIFGLSFVYYVLGTTLVSRVRGAK